MKKKPLEIPESVNPELMKFKCEIQIKSGRVVVEYRFAKDLSVLESDIKKEFPKGKIISIVGGY